MPQFSQTIRSRALRFSGLLAFAVMAGVSQPAAAQFASVEPAPQSAQRTFAPGVETIIPPAIDPKETLSQHEMIELRADPSLDWTPNLLTDPTVFQRAAGAKFTREVWCLEFGFKPLRMIRLVDPQTDSGQRLVWYLVYRVKNTGEGLKATRSDADGGFEAVTTPIGPVRFQPHLVLQGQDIAPDGGRIYRAYLDQPMPEAIEAIRQRETPGRKLFGSNSMPLTPLQPNEERWGVAMWSDIDPEIDFFSVFVRGLTNAYEWTDPPGVYQPGDPPGKGREFVRKTLQLNFWRPGDRFLQHENEVRYGAAPGKASLYGVEEGVDYRWVYR